MSSKDAWAAAELASRAVPHREKLVNHSENSVEGRRSPGGDAMWVLSREEGRQAARGASRFP